jgi:sterol-4alpha-carboxylate 3-dehydrogenase (decarboxylating)
MNTLTSGKHKYQLGNGENLFDWTYVDNITHAHLLASDKLETRGYDVRLLGAVHLPRALGEEERPERGVPTSEERDDVQGATDYARKLPSTLSKETREENLNVRPVVRNKYDQFFYLVHPDVASPGSPIPEAPLATEFIPVAGEAFFITNGQPVPFWSFARALWKEASPAFAASDAKPWAIPREMALSLSTYAELYSRLTGKEIALTTLKTIFATTTRYYNIEKARRVLGYEPKVGLQEGIKRSAQVSWREGLVKASHFAKTTGLTFLTGLYHSGGSRLPRERHSRHRKPLDS